MVASDCRSKSADILGRINMKRIVFTALACVFCTKIAFSKTPVKVYDLSSASISGDILRGPRIIVVHNLNVLRYNYQFNGVITYSQPVDLWSKLTSAVSGTPPAGTPPALVGAPSLPHAALSSTCEAELAGQGANAAVMQHVCAARRIEATITATQTLTTEN
jgi:hypothetical protein